jgi:hypothetical protein
MHFQEVFGEGTRVRIKGLVNSPEFNGKEGIISGYSTEKKRYEVSIGGKKKRCQNSIGGKKKMFLKPDNIEEILQARKPMFANIDDMVGGTQAFPEETKVCLNTITSCCTSYLSRIL